MGMGPVPASKLYLQKAGWTVVDLELMKINEEFAAMHTVAWPRCASAAAWA